MPTLHQVTVPRRKTRLLLEPESPVCWTAQRWDRAARLPLRCRLTETQPRETPRLCSPSAETCRFFPFPARFGRQVPRQGSPPLMGGRLAASSAEQMDLRQINIEEVP